MTDEIATFKSRIAELEAENAGLRAKLSACEEERDTSATDNHDRIAELNGQVDALQAKIDVLAPNGTCGCSYDKPGDVCMHHSPMVATLRARMDEAEAALQTVDDRRWLRLFAEEPWQLSDFGNAFSCGSQQAHKECSDIARAYFVSHSKEPE